MDKTYGSPGAALIGELVATREAACVGPEAAIKGPPYPHSVLALFVSSVKEGQGAEPRPSCHATTDAKL